MNLSVQETYLGWTEPAHAKDCARPSWTVDVREDEGYRASYAGGTVRHACTDEDCDHDSRYPRTTVRMVCRGCHSAYVLRGEFHNSHHTTTKETGFGQPPRLVSGLYVWPGEPWFDREPHEWLVTRGKPARIRRMDLIGEIHEERGPRGGKQYAPLALPSTEGTYGRPGAVRWQRAEGGLRSFAATVKWVSAQRDVDGGTA